MILAVASIGFGSTASRLEGAELSIVSAKAGSPLEKLAAREIGRYVYLRTGVLASMANDDKLPPRDCIVVARKDRPILATLAHSEGLAARTRVLR